MRVRFLLLILLFTLALGVRFWLFFLNDAGYKNKEPARFSARLFEEPEISSGKQTFGVMDDKGTRIKVTTTTVNLYHYGDNLFIDGIFTKKYQRYFINYPQIQIITSDQNILSQIDTYIKNTSKKIFYSSIPQTSSALLLGMVFGGRQGLPQDFLDKLRITGVVHVIAASGMNVTMVATVLVSLFGKIFKRQIVLGLSVIGVVFYAFLAGFEPSIVRAAVMSIVAMTAAFLGKQYLAQFSLILTGYFMLFYNPGDLFDIGFQLSFLATWGILEIKPLLPLQNFFLGDDIGTTLAAQIATFPVLFAAFGQYGALSLIVNVAVLWTVPFLMIFGALGILIGMFIPFLGTIFVWLSWPFLLYFERIVTFAADLNWVWTTQGLTWEFIIGYYLLIMALVLFFKQRTAKTTLQPA